MKIFIVIIFIAAIFVFSAFPFLRNSDSQKTTKTNFNNLIKDEWQKPGIPTNLSIPKININATVQKVGRDKNGHMDVPTNFIDTGWYKYGFKPGEVGSAVIDGHYDTRIGTPAVFYNLTRLEIGDEIYIVDTKKRKYLFIVTKIAYYPFDNSPLTEIFMANDKPRLNLITCNGIYNQKLGLYSERVVIYSELKETIEPHPILSFPRTRESI